MKKAFTLVELLVVVGIIGILAGILLGVTSGSTESARNAQCLANLRALSAACSTYGMSHGYFPLAGSVEKMSASVSGSSVKMKYNEIAGWLSWNSRSAYPSESKQASGDWYVSAYNTDAETREYCYTNGALWKYISGNRTVFQCPEHVRKHKGTEPAWSYVMNSYFGWSLGETPTTMPQSYYGISFEHMARADRRLLFAEMQFEDVDSLKAKDGSGSGLDCDCTLQYSKDEYIGFNHKSGKRSRVAHVCYADGHVDRLRMPKDGMSESDAKELTELLCKGKDVTFDGSKYEELK